MAMFYCFSSSLVLAGPWDLSSWSKIHYYAAGDGDGVWEFGGRGNVATQTANCDPSILLGDFDISGCQIRGTLTGGAKEDYIGFVFGYQSRGQFYLFDWKRESQPHDELGQAEKGMRVKRLSAPVGSDPTGTDFWVASDTANMKVLMENLVGWEPGAKYEFLLNFVPGQFEIIVFAGRAELVHWTIADSTYTWGRFGFYDFSEPGATYSLIAVDCNEVTIHVDDDALSDPGPDDSAVSDPLENGTKEHPFDMIQEGIDAAPEGATVLVREGTYYETIEFRGNNIDVASFDPEAGDAHVYPVIDAGYSGTVVTFNKAEDLNCTLSGFVLTRGEGTPVLGSSEDPTPPKQTALVATIRDFRDTHPDFEMSGLGYIETGIVERVLGSDGKPVYAKGDGRNSPSTTGRANFDQCYRHVAGVNTSTPFALILEDVDSDGIYTYADDTFFPIDNQLFGNQGRTHNFHFTMELHSQFAYQAGQTFTFTGNDDLWVFVNDQLAVDLGGGHSARSAFLELDTFGLTPDHIYDFDLFFAERHTTASTFQMETSIVLEPTYAAMSGAAGAIACIGASPYISNCVIVGNRCADPLGSDPLGGVIYCIDSNSIFENCTIADNYAGTGGAGMYFIDSNAVIANCIVWGNMPEEILTASGTAPVVSYSNVLGTWHGRGNADVDPAFAFPGYWADLTDPDTALDPSHPDAMWLDGDYHLMSRAGRWDPVNQTWIKDDHTSLCIDAGDPNSPWQREPEPNGERINLGAYGGTAQASMSGGRCSLTLSSTAGGSVAAPGEGESTHDCGTLVPIEAAAEDCYRFTEWTGTAVSAGKVADPNSASTTVRADADYTLIAHFELGEYCLEISSTEGGTVVEPGEGRHCYGCGETITIELQPDEYHHFVGWTVEPNNVFGLVDVNSARIAMTLGPDLPVSSIVVTPNVKKNNLWVEPNSPGGSVEFPDGKPSMFSRHTPVRIVAKPDPCYHFTHWSGSAAKAGKVADVNAASTTVTVDADYTLVANFEPNEPSNLTVSSTAGGSVTAPGEDVFTYDCGTSVPIEAVAENCYRFTEWTGSAVSTGKVADRMSASTTVTVEANYTLIASFTLDKVNLTVSSTAGGSVTAPGEGESTHDCGTSVPIEAAADACYEFSHWTGTAVSAGKVADSTSASTTVTVDADYTLIANFTLDTVTLTVSSTTGGSVTAPDEGESTHECGKSVSIEAGAEDCYRFTEWTGTAVSAGKVADANSASTTVVVDADYTLQAHFAVRKVRLTITSDEHGSVTAPGEGEFTYDCGALVEVYAEPDPGWEFVGWEGSAVDQGRVEPNETSPRVSVTVDDDYDLKALFQRIPCTLTISATAGGSTDPGAGVHYYSCGSEVYVEAVADPGHRFLRWEGTARDAGKIISWHEYGDDAAVRVKVDGDYTLEAVFE